MSLDTELETWRREWQSETTVPPDLRRRVERQSRWRKVTVAGDILVTVVIGGGVIALAAREPQRFRIVDGRADREAMAREIWDIVEPYV